MNLRAILALLALLFAGAPALGQQVNVYCSTGTGFTTWQPASAGFPCPVTATISGGGITPTGKTTTQAKLTVAVTNTYQQALAAATTRVGCTIQYIAVAGTKGYVYFGSSPSDTTTSFQLSDKQSINCAIGGIAVATDAVQVTGTGTDIFIVTNQ